MKALFKSGLWIFSLAILAACQTKENNSQINLDPQEFQQQLNLKKDKAILVDVRTPEEFREGHLQGALSIDYNSSTFADGLATLPKDKEVYIYCRSGGRSNAAVPIFLKAGFKTVTNLTQGISGWQSAGLPVTLD